MKPTLPLIDYPQQTVGLPTCPVGLAKPVYEHDPGRTATVDCGVVRVAEVPVRSILLLCANAGP